MSTNNQPALSFEDERIDRIKKLVGIGASFFSFPLYLVFWLADLLVAPQWKWTFLLIRASIIPSLLLCNAGIKRTHSPIGAQIWGSLATVANSIPITAMIYLMDDYSSPYYAGLNLANLGMGAFLPVTHRFFFLNIVLVYAPYVILGFMKTNTSNYHPFLLNLFFIIGVTVIIAVVHFVNEILYKREYSGRARLSEEVLSRGKIIETKTKEAIQLAQLTKQFSPQVLHSIQAGILDITKPVHSASVCAIFIDIVDSTERLVELDKDVVHRVLAMYMEDTMPVLLKYDITIDKFLGDGVLAFSNDPIQHSDYIERVIIAAVEIRGRMEVKQAAYRKLWGKEFEIRIGIASGKANVGFYGHENYTRSYTAIGPVINLASRLLTAAKPNQILLTKAVAETVRQSGGLKSVGIDFVELGQRELKGFRTEKFDVYQVTNSEAESNVVEHISTCPHGHGILYLDQNERGIFAFKCRVCNYEDSGRSNENTGEKKAA